MSSGKFRSSPRVANASAKFSLFLATLNARTLPLPKKDLVESQPRTRKYPQACNYPNFFASPSPVGYGWKLEDNQLQIVWGTQEPPPESILECVHCKCQKGYKTRRCSCYKSDLKCTEMCQCNSCENSDILADELIELEAQFLENKFELEECEVDDDDY